MQLHASNGEDSDDASRERHNLVICCMGSRENYVGSVSNNNNPKFPDQHI